MNLHKRLPIQFHLFANYRPMFAICQDYYALGGEERRRIERVIMSICLTWFPIGGLGEPDVYQNLRDFTRIGKIVGGSSSGWCL